MRTLRLTAIALATTALTVASAGSTFAAPTKAGVKITRAKGADGGGVDVRGKVTSIRPACEKNRRVEVYHDVAPNGPSSGDFSLGETVTNDEGIWKLSTVFAPDKVRAKVKKDKRKDCAGDLSRTKTVKFD